MISAILIVVFFIWLYNFHWKRRNLPPGPAPLPIVGNTPFLNKYGIEMAFILLKKRYGDIHTVWYGETPLVMICDAPTIMETFVRDADAYSGRPFNQIVAEMRTNGRNGLIFNDGPNWRHHRRDTLHIFRNFGMGKSLMQEKVLDEVQQMIQKLRLEAKNGDSVEVYKKFDLAAGNMINTLLFGYRFENEQEFIKLKEIIQEHLHSVGTPFMRMLNFNPWLHQIIPEFLLKKFKISLEKMHQFFEKQIKEHEKRINFETNDEPNDFVEYFLRQKNKSMESGTESELYTNNQLFGSCIDLWLAGQENIALTLSWAVIYLMNNPKIQQKLHEELDAVIGCDRLVTTDDKPRLNYLNAVLAETQRYANLVPLNIPQRTTRDVFIKGYKIPKDTAVTHQIWSVMRDDRYFPEPEKFRPERFLDGNGKFFQPSEFMPFGVGKRACMGESLAKMELFLFFGNLFNHFEIAIDSKCPPVMDKIIGATTQPKPFACKLKIRY